MLLELEQAVKHDKDKVRLTVVVTVQNKVD